MSKYNRIKNRLARVNETYKSSNLLRKKEMLLDSYAFAVLSVQTPVPIHEDAWEGYMDGKELEKAFESVNYKYNKIKYIEYTKNRSYKIFEKILSSSNLDKIHRMLVDHFKGVGVIKSAFTLAMLGYMDKICIDANLLTYFGLERDEIYTGKVVEKYESQCEDLLSQVELDLEPFMLQWILFNIARMKKDRNFSKHEPYFDKMFQKYC